MQNKIYSFEWLSTIAAGANQNCNALIRNANRSLHISNIVWDWYCNVNLAGFQQIINKNTNTTQLIQLTLYGPAVGDRIANFAIPQAPLALQNNGVNVILFTPGQYFYKNFFTPNDLNIQFLQNNTDPLNSINMYCSITIETIEE